MTEPTEVESSGLLADPAQTTELEKLRRHLSASDGAGREWHSLATNGVTASAKWKGQRDLLLWLHAEAAWRVVGFDALTAALARHLKEAQAERDALSLLLRGMARKLAAYRKWTLGDDVPAVHRLRRELAETTADVDKFRDYLRMANNIVERRGAERDERQARIDEIADVLGRAPGDATSAEIVEIVRTAVAVKGRRRDEAMELRARIDAVTATCEAADVMVRMGMATSTLRWETAKAVLDDVRAALVGDQGKNLGENQAESGGSKALTSGNSWANRDLDLSGEALRAVEEADDAAGDLP